jgi:hypothetical protein
VLDTLLEIAFILFAVLLTYFSLELIWETREQHLTRRALISALHAMVYERMSSCSVRPVPFDHERGVFSAYRMTLFSHDDVLVREHCRGGYFYAIEVWIPNYFGYVGVMQTYTCMTRTRLTRNLPDQSLDSLEGKNSIVPEHDGSILSSAILVLIRDKIREYKLENEESLYDAEFANV